MKKGSDTAAKFDGLYLVHQNIPGKKVDSVRYKQHILFIPLQGEIRISIADHLLAVGPGQMLYISAGTLHSFSSSDHAGERLIAMIDFNRLEADFLKSSHKIIPLHQLIKEILFYLLLNPNTRSSRSLISVFCETLAEMLFESKFDSEITLRHLEGKILDPRLKHALAYMRDNFERNLSMDAVARESGLSHRSFSRLMAIETGLQPKQWLIGLRIEKAKELLKQSDSSVTDVALAVGYNSLGQFISAFRSRTGQLPSDYLKHGPKP